MYQRIEKNSGFNLVHCFLISLIVSWRYHHFTNGTPNHCCQSLKHHCYCPMVLMRTTKTAVCLQAKPTFHLLYGF